jgi:hypothetical protein
MVCDEIISTDLIKSGFSSIGHLTIMVAHRPFTKMSKFEIDVVSAIGERYKPMKISLVYAAVLTLVTAMASFAHCGTCDKKDDCKKDGKKGEKGESKLVISI